MEEDEQEKDSWSEGQSSEPRNTEWLLRTFIEQRRREQLVAGSDRIRSQSMDEDTANATIAAIERAIDQGKSVTFWEVVGAALHDSHGVDLFSEQLLQLARDFHADDIDKNEATRRLTELHDDAFANLDSALELVGYFQQLVTGLEAFGRASDLHIENHVRNESWRRLRRSSGDEGLTGL